jgi:hypothetical protein
MSYFYTLNCLIILQIKKLKTMYIPDYVLFIRFGILFGIDKSEIRNQKWEKSI